MLMGNGRTAAREFLDAFNLDGYMNTFHQPVVAAQA
jgi:hypothetical protein